MTLLAQVAILLAATVVAIPLFRRLGLSSILGYLTAGMALGPWGLGVIRNDEGLTHLAELGVVLLLFVIGLELQPSRLRALRRMIFGLGSLQVTSATLVFTAIGYALGLSLNAAAIVGFALSLSSTPLVLQLLAERTQLNTHHGRSSFAILLFQDIAVIVVLALLPLLGTQARDTQASGSLLGLAQGLGVLLLLIFVGRLVLRPVLRVVAATKVREAFTAAALLVVIATALLVSWAGLSMALGAFVAGLLLADSEYRHELEADIEPFKGLLLGLFFISVGMSANLGLLLEQPLRVVALSLGLLTIKFALLWLLGRVSGHSPASSRALAFAMPQAGEFGFVLFSLAVSEGVLAQSLAEILVIVVTISMIVSPLLMMLHGRLDAALTENTRNFDRIEDADGRVLIAGFGRFGQIVGRVLRMRKIPFTALEASVAQVDFVRRFGNRVYYGDASRLDLLESAGAARAEILVLAIDDVEASVRTVEVVRKHFPKLKILARARNRQHALRLMDLGVRYIVRETYLSSLDMAQHALETLGLPRAEARTSIERFSAHDDQALRSQLLIRDDEQKLIQNAQMAARELEKLFEADQARDTSPPHADS
jgi:monovalent cation:proton antiporter-2 (CPA2) family protein